MTTRCNWVADLADDDLMVSYHDQEWGRPDHDERDLFELLALEGFQAGLSWRTVLTKRPAFRQAFHNFEAQQVAAFTEADVDRLMANADIIRNRRKIAATIHNAEVIVGLHEQGQSLSELVWSLVDNQQVVDLTPAGQTMPAQTPLSQTLSKRLKSAGFQFVGPVTMASFLQACGVVNAHSENCDFK